MAAPTVPAQTEDPKEPVMPAFMAANGGETGFMALYKQEEIDDHEDLMPILQEAVDFMETRVQWMKQKIKISEKKKAKLLNRLTNTTQRYERVTARWNARRQMLRDYKKTIDAVQAGYDSIRESTATLLEGLRIQGQVGNEPPDEDEQMAAITGSTNVEKAGK